MAFSGHGITVIPGLASGFASGLFGIGGGIVRISIFIYLLPLFGAGSRYWRLYAIKTRRGRRLRRVMA